MYNKIVENIELSLRAAKRDLEWKEKSIVIQKEELLETIVYRDQILKNIEEYSLFLIENGVNPNETEVEK